MNHPITPGGTQPEHPLLHWMAYGEELKMEAPGVTQAENDPRNHK
jgi:hypothetical protein